MPVSNFPNGFSQGLSVRGLPVLNSYAGNVFWVDSSTGSDSNRGDREHPFATLDYAVGQCTANNGDFIVLYPGHAESLTADSAVDIDVAGVTVMAAPGAVGADRPTFTFTTAVTADFKLAANNVTVQGLLFVAGIDALTGPIEVGADDCAIINCEYRDDDTNNYETTDVIVTTATPLRMLIDDFVFRHDGGSGGTQNQSVIQLNGADHAIIRNCRIVADSGTGVIEDATTSDQILIENCLIENTETSPTVAILLTATTTGAMRFVHARVASGTTYLTAGNDMQFFECWGVGTDADRANRIGAAGPDSIEGALFGADGITTFPEPATAADGVSIAEVLSWTSARNSVPGGINPLGSVYYVAASGGNDSATGNGLDPNEPLATIATAITNSSAGDTIVLGPGTHSVDVSAAALAPKADTRLVAAIPPYGGKPSTIITHDADDGADLVLVDVDGVVFEGIEFLNVAGGTTAIRTVAVSQTTAVNGLVFKDCWFNQNSVDAAGIISLAVNDATNDTTGLVVKNCRFLGGDATTNQAIYIDIGVGGATRALIEDCMFECESADADCLALNFADPGASGGSYGLTFRNNDIIGPKDGGGDGVPIVFAAAMTEDEIVAMIRTNYFSGTSATPITQDEVNTSIIRNYVGDDATGGTLVDPGT